MVLVRMQHEVHALEAQLEANEVMAQDGYAPHPTRPGPVLHGALLVFLLLCYTILIPGLGIVRESSIWNFSTIQRLRLDNQPDRAEASLIETAAAGLDRPPLLSQYCA